MEDTINRELAEFKTEVLTQLAVINSKLDGYSDMKQKTYEANDRSKQNEKQIINMEKRLKALEDKPIKTYDNVKGQIISIVVGTVFGGVIVGLVSLVLK